MAVAQSSAEMFPGRPVGPPSSEGDDMSGRSTRATPSDPGTGPGSPQPPSAGPAGGVDTGVTPWTEPDTLLLEQWKARVSAAQHAHYYMMGRLKILNTWLGVPVVVLTAVVGTSLFATLARSSNNTSAVLRATLAVISVAAAILSALQTFFKFGERSEKHAIAADWFSALRREIEQYTGVRSTDRPPSEVVGDLRKEINKVVQNSPAIGERVWHRFATRYGAPEPMD
jgi:hypothetical protein